MIIYVNVRLKKNVGLKNKILDVMFRRIQKIPSQPVSKWRSLRVFNITSGSPHLPEGRNAKFSLMLERGCGRRLTRGEAFGFHKPGGKSLSSRSSKPSRPMWRVVFASLNLSWTTSTKRWRDFGGAIPERGVRFIGANGKS